MVDHMESSLTLYGNEWLCVVARKQDECVECAWGFRVTGDFRAIGLPVIPVTPSAAEVR